MKKWRKQIPFNPFAKPIQCFLNELNGNHYNPLDLNHPTSSRYDNFPRTKNRRESSLQQTEMDHLDQMMIQFTRKSVELLLFCPRVPFLLGCILQNKRLRRSQTSFESRLLTGNNDDDDVDQIAIQSPIEWRPPPFRDNDDDADGGKIQATGKAYKGIYLRPVLAMDDSTHSPSVLEPSNKCQCGGRFSRKKALSRKKKKTTHEPQLYFGWTLFRTYTDNIIAQHCGRDRHWHYWLAPTLEGFHFLSALSLKSGSTKMWMNSSSLEWSKYWQNRFSRIHFSNSLNNCAVCSDKKFISFSWNHCKNL